MAPPHTSPTAATRSDHQRGADTPLPSRWLVLTRAVWVVTAILALAALLASIPGYVLVASQGDFAGRVVAAPVELVRILDLAGVLASFTSALVCIALGALLYWRKPGDSMALFVSFYLLVYGIVFAGPLERLALLVPGADLLATDVLQPILFVVPTLALLALFPNGRFVPNWTRWLVPFAALLAPIWLLLARDVPAQWWANPTNWLIWAYCAFAVPALGAALYAQVYRYRRVSGPSERQQAKWVASGVLCWVLLAGVGDVVLVASSLPPDAAVPWWTPVGQFLWWLSLDIVPLSLTIAVLRYHLFDIDMFIRRTLVYGTLTGILGAIYFSVVAGAQSVLHALTGQQTPHPPLIIVATTLLIAALFTPLRRGIQATIDRRFYRRKYDAAQTIAAFDNTLRTEADLSHVTERLVTVVEETMQPAHVSLWLREPPHDAKRYVPGMAVPALTAGIPSSQHISARPRLAYPDTQRHLASG